MLEQQHVRHTMITSPNSNGRTFSLLLIHCLSTANDDYQPISVVEFVLDGVAMTYAQSIIITDDSILEDVEKFVVFLNLVGVNQQVTISPAQTTVQIMDNDGEKDVWILS